MSREEYESCRITNPKPRIVAICNQPHKLMYFTITFRSFTPTPGGLEFHPGQDYYFISTSSRDDLHRRVGGGCHTHNMKMIFKVHQKLAEEEDLSGEPLTNLLQFAPVKTTTTTTTTTTTPAPPRRRMTYLNEVFYGSSPLAKVRSHRRRPESSSIYYYHPRDVVAMEESAFDLVSGRLRQDRREETYESSAEDRYTSENALQLTSSPLSSSAASLRASSAASSSLTAAAAAATVVALAMFGSAHSRWL